MAQQERDKRDPVKIELTRVAARQEAWRAAALTQQSTIAAQWSRDSQYIYFERISSDREVLRVGVWRAASPMQIVSLKDSHQRGSRMVFADSGRRSVAAWPWRRHRDLCAPVGCSLIGYRLPSHFTREVEDGLARLGAAKRVGHLNHRLRMIPFVSGARGPNLIDEVFDSMTGTLSSLPRRRKF